MLEIRTLSKIISQECIVLNYILLVAYGWCIDVVICAGLLTLLSESIGNTCCDTLNVLPILAIAILVLRY